jgi:hypothetical protein
MFQVKAYIKKTVNLDYERERAEYKVKMTEYRKRHFKDYWERQTQVENDFLEKNR